ncbi:MAG: YihY/virulence factor BrkB family protein [Acidimicrobiales bacterium]
MAALFQRILDFVDGHQRRHAWLSVPVAVVRKFGEDRAGDMGAVVAYFGFLSLFPLLLAFAAILGFVLAGHPDLQRQVLHNAEHSFPALSGYLDNAVSGSRLALGLGLAGALWAGTGVTRGLERAMNAIWDIPVADRPNLWRSRLRGLVMLCVLGATALASTALAGLRTTSGLLAWPAQVLGVLGEVGLNFALYLLAFQVLTNRSLRWRAIVPGAALGAVGWTILQELGAFFTRYEIAHASHLYGTLAVVVGLLAWIYLGARFTFYAAEVNVVLEYRLWPRSLTGRRTDADHRALARQVHETETVSAR